MSSRLGNPETLRKWTRQAEADAGEVKGVSTRTMQEIAEMKVAANLGALEA